MAGRDDQPLVLLRLSGDDARVLIEVWDANSRPPEDPGSDGLPDVDAEGGRGLFLVAALSACWNVRWAAARSLIHWSVAPGFSSVVGVSMPGWAPVAGWEPEAGRRFLFREDVLYQCEDLGNGVKVEYFGELPDVLCVAGPRGECLHCEEMLG